VVEQLILIVGAKFKASHGCFNRATERYMQRLLCTIADEKLCHNCDTKPVLGAKTDFIDGVRLLILGNLSKPKGPSLHPAYMARPPFSTAYERQGFAMNWGALGCAPINRLVNSRERAVQKAKCVYVSSGFESLTQRRITFHKRVYGQLPDCRRLGVDLLLPGASSRALQSSLSLFQITKRNKS